MISFDTYHFYYEEMLEENKCADSFIGTLAYMSPDRVRGIPYSFEADMWSLGITMITIIAGKPPFPTNRGPWHLMNAIIQGPQPFLDPAIVSHDLRSFIHDCLNQPPQVSTCAVKLLEHDFLTSAKKRGVITTPAFLPIPGLLMHCSDPTAEVIDKIVEAAISWQLECFEDQKIFQFTAKKNDARGDKIEEPIVYSKMPRYSVEKIRGLAAQMLIDNTILEEK